MTNSNIQKSISQNIPLSSFAPLPGDGKDTDLAAFFRQQLYQRFGVFPGELKISAAKEIVSVQWCFPEINKKAEFFHGKALEYAKKKDFRTAIASWQDAITLNPQDPDYLFNLGAAHLEMKHYSEALSPFQKAAELCPIYPKVHLFLGTLFLKLRKVKPAAKFLENNLFFQPNDALALLNLGISYSILRDHQQAIDM
ncbi:tetratricopeptide repeat protein, partial [bacterium]|nr:tetratricopeptide repeat protein [bacterium]